MIAKEVFIFSLIAEHVCDPCLQRGRRANSHRSGMRSTVSVSDGQFALAAAFC